MNRWFAILIFLSAISLPMGKAYCDELPVVIAGEMIFKFKTGRQEEVVKIRQSGGVKYIKYYCDGVLVVDNILKDKVRGAEPGYVIGLHLATRGDDCSRGAAVGVYLADRTYFGTPALEYWVFMFTDNRLVYSGRGH